jgi:hypothetical protein
VFLAAHISIFSSLLAKAIAQVWRATPFKVQGAGLLLELIQIPNASTDALKVGFK